MKVNVPHKNDAFIGKLLQYKNFISSPFLLVCRTEQPCSFPTYMVLTAVGTVFDDFSFMSEGVEEVPL